MKTNIVIGSLSLLGILCACSEQEIQKTAVVNLTVSELKLESESGAIIEESKVQFVEEVQIQAPELFPDPAPDPLPGFGWGTGGEYQYQEPDEPILMEFILPQQKLELEYVFNAIAKSYKTVIINQNRDTTLTFKEGTKVTIKANSFQFESGGVLSDSQVELSVGEYYELGDLLTGNLNTQTKDGILETGGTVYIEAKSGGQKCELKEGMNLEIEFPTEKKVGNMQTFEGKWKNSRIVWEPELEISASFFYWVDADAQYPGGALKLTDYITKSVLYPEEAIENNREGVVSTSFVIDTNGRISDIKIEQGEFECLNQESMRVIQEMPNWIPAENNGSKVATKVRLPITYTLDNGFPNKETSSGKKRSFKSFEDKMNSEGEAVIRSSEVSSYILSVSNLGWINCDRFYEDSREKVALVVEVKPEENVNMKLVFDTRKSVMQAFKTDGKYTFNRIPVGERVTVVAVKIVDNECYFAIQKATVGSNPIGSMNYKKVTMEELQSAMAGLNW